MESIRLARLSRLLEEAPIKTALALMALAAFIVVGLTVLDRAGFVSFDFIAANWTFLLGPAELALFATIVSYVIGFGFAIPMGAARAFGPGILKRRDTSAWIFAPIYGFVSGYAEAVRGTPVYVQILLVHGLVTAAVPKLSAVSLWAGIIALTINTAGYQTEVFRAGFQSVGQGQLEAAKSIGMRKFQITLPLVNEWIALFKASSLLSAISVLELMWGAQYIGVNLGHPIDGFLMVSFYYLVILIPLSRVVSYIESKKRIPGLGTAEPARTRFIGFRRTAPQDLSSFLSESSGRVSRDAFLQRRVAHTIPDGVLAQHPSIDPPPRERGRDAEGSETIGAAPRTSFFSRTADRLGLQSGLARGPRRRRESFQH